MAIYGVHGCSGAHLKRIEREACAHSADPSAWMRWIGGGNDDARSPASADQGLISIANAANHLVGLAIYRREKSRTPSPLLVVKRILIPGLLLRVLVSDLIPVLQAQAARLGCDGVLIPAPALETERRAFAKLAGRLGFTLTAEGWLLASAAAR